jgi:hypothetical protein
MTVGRKWIAWCVRSVRRLVAALWRWRRPTLIATTNAPDTDSHPSLGTSGQVKMATQPDRQRTCSSCRALPEEPCVVTIGGVKREMAGVHLARRLPEDDGQYTYPPMVQVCPATRAAVSEATLTMSGIQFDPDAEDYLEDVLALRPILPVSPLLTGSSPGTCESMSKSKIDEKTLLQFIKKNGNQRHEQIAAGLKVTTKETGPLLRALVATGKVKTTGERRATRYDIK